MTLSYFHCHLMYNKLLLFLFDDAIVNKVVIEDVENIETDVAFFSNAVNLILDDIGVDFSIDDHFYEICRNDQKQFNFYDRFASLVIGNNVLVRVLINKFGFGIIEDSQLIYESTYLYLSGGMVQQIEYDRSIQDDKFSDFEVYSYFKIAQDFVRLADTSIDILEKKGVISRNESIEQKVELEFYDEDNPVDRIDSIGNAIHEFIKRLIPQVKDLIDNQIRYRLYSEELSNCKAGRKDWRNYEIICEKIYKLAFTPQFSRLYPQSRTFDGHERRDLVIPNTLYNGVWNSLFHVYNCNNIIVEFKNKDSHFDKSVVSQLRIYLQKKTIGRFGILNVRNKDSQILRKSILEAFNSNSTLLILLFDDEDLLKMLMTKIVYGKVDYFIESKKIEFEIAL